MSRFTSIIHGRILLELALNERRGDVCKALGLSHAAVVVLGKLAGRQPRWATASFRRGAARALDGLASEAGVSRDEMIGRLVAAAQARGGAYVRHMLMSAAIARRARSIRPR